MFPGVFGAGIGVGCHPINHPWVFFNPDWLNAPSGLSAVYKCIVHGLQPSVAEVQR